MLRFAQMGCVTLLMLASAGVFSRLQAEEATVAVASNFSQAMDSLIEEFELMSPHTVRVVYGSSGRLYAQIAQGAPFHVFLSADADKPSLLVENGIAVPGTQVTYGIGQLALWSNGAVPQVTSLQAIKQPAVKKLALANPRLAPYGLAGQQVLESMGLWASAPFRLVQGENIAQAYQFVYSGNADIGFVSLAQIIGAANEVRTSYWPVPEDLHEPIIQDAVLLQQGQSNSAALAFLDFISSGAARAIIESFGYRTPLAMDKGNN